MSWSSVPTVFFNFINSSSTAWSHLLSYNVYFFFFFISELHEFLNVFLFVLCTWLMISSPWPVGLYKSRWIYSAPLKILLLHIPYHNTMSALPRGMYGVMKNDSVALLSAHKSFSIQGSDGGWKPKRSHRVSGAVHCGLCSCFSALNDEWVIVAESAAAWMCFHWNIRDVFSDLWGTFLLFQWVSWFVVAWCHGLILNANAVTVVLKIGVKMLAKISNRSSV